jgi:MoaA/NifB/PqqE/SkfB family radical SAM enzyme
MHRFSYLIDIVGVCNLRCPSCPVGNSPGLERPSGLMSTELFTEIVKKIKRETPDCKYIQLYNWTEPSLHPELSEFIRIARRHRLRPRISTNLNLFRRMEEVIAAEPWAIRISVSGFSQEKYGRTHERGKIEAVIRGMHQLRETIDRLNANTRLEVYYHCYVDNIGEDYEKMAALCEKLKIGFEPIWAYLMPVEKNLEYFEAGLTGKDRELVDLLAIDPKRAREIALENPSPDCVLRSEMTTINCDGSVALCCAVYDTEHTIAKGFLDVSHAELQSAKYANPFCGTCMKHGLHDSLTYKDVRSLHEAALERIHPAPLPRHFAEALSRKQGRKTGIVRKLRKRLLGRPDRPGSA